MEEKAEKTPKAKSSKARRHTPVKRKLDFESPGSSTKKARVRKSPKKPQKVAPKVPEDESGNESDDDMDDDLFKGPFARSPKPAKPQKQDPEGDGREEADESENESAKSLDYEHSKEGVPRDDSKTEDPTEVEIDDMLLQLLPASSSKFLGFIHSTVTSTGDIGPKH